MKSGSFLPLLMPFEIWPTWFKVKPPNHRRDTICWGVGWAEMPDGYLLQLQSMRTSRTSSWENHQPHLGLSKSLSKLSWCLQTRSEHEDLKRSNKRGCWRTPIGVLFFTLPVCFLFTVKGMHQRTGWCHPSHRISPHASVWSAKAPLLNHP